MAHGKDNNLRKLNFVYYLLELLSLLSQGKWEESWLGWIHFKSKLQVKIENQVSGILFGCFFAFSTLLMLLKGIGLIKWYVQ